MMLNKSLFLKIISFFYIFLLFFYIFALALFSTRLVVFSKPLSGLIAFGAHSTFMIFLFLLFFFFRAGEKSGFWMAFFFHIFFLANFILMLFWETTLFSLENPHSDQLLISPTFFLVPAIIINLAFIYFLLSCRDSFRN